MASRLRELWTAAALAVALSAGMGCQARHLSNTAPHIQTVSASGPPERRSVASSPLRHREPNARIFRGSVAAAPMEDNLVSR